MRDAPDNVGDMAVSASLDRTVPDEECGERTGDGEADTGMDGTCLDDDTSGDETETERMSVSGDPHPLPASSEPGSSRIFQDSSINTAKCMEKINPSSRKTSDSEEIFSFFESTRPPPIPAKRILSGTLHSSDTESNGKKLEFRPQYDTIRAAKLRQINTVFWGQWVVSSEKVRKKTKWRALT